MATQEQLDLEKTITVLNQIAKDHKYQQADSRELKYAIGMRKETPGPANSEMEQRNVDGFNVSFKSGKDDCVMKLTYSTQLFIRDMHDKDFVKDLEQLFNQIISFLKNEFKKRTGKAVELKQMGEINTNVQHMSNIKTWSDSICYYEVSPVNFKSLNDVMKKFIVAKKKLLMPQEKDD